MNTETLPIGTILDSPISSYRIEGILGQGGFGITYKASTKVRYGNLDLQVPVAIKELFIADSTQRGADGMTVVCPENQKQTVEGSKADFVAEARRLYNIGASIPGIVKVNEVFEANNTAYYVMEYIEGEPLSKYVRSRQKLDSPEAVEIMTPVIETVGMLHANKMTHLDLKPDNIMLSKGENGNLKATIIDFGLSKHYTDDGSPTSTINVMGCSDGYAPLEQYAGITTFMPVADLYALGATLYFCVTGNVPRKAALYRPGEIRNMLQTQAPQIADAIANAMDNDRYARTQTTADLIAELHGHRKEDLQADIIEDDSECTYSIPVPPRSSHHVHHDTPQHPAPDYAPQPQHTPQPQQPNYGPQQPYAQQPSPYYQTPQQSGPIAPQQSSRKLVLIAACIAAAILAIILVWLTTGGSSSSRSSNSDKEYIYYNQIILPSQSPSGLC